MCVCWSVCLSVNTVEGNQLELSTPNFVDVEYMAVSQHTLTPRLKSDFRGEGCLVIKCAAAMDVPVDRAA